MWQLEIDATNASSGSTLAGFEKGARTAAGDGEAGTVTPPSNVQVCSREYVPFRKSPCECVHLMVALCSDIFPIPDENHCDSNYLASEDLRAVPVAFLLGR